MISRIWNWLFPPKADRWEELTIYKPKQRFIFTFFDGEKMVKRDPLHLYKTLMDKHAIISSDYKMSISPSKKAHEGHVNMLKGMREVFGVKTVDENGLTDVEVIQLYTQFLEFSEEIKKNLPPTPPAVPPSETSPSSSGEGQTTPSSLASGSTEKCPSTSSPTQSS